MLLPRPYPDEVIGSIVSRGYHRTGLSWTRYVNLVTGRSVSSMPYLMPFALDRFAEATGCSEERLLERHTLFPYATGFMEPARRGVYKYRALRPGGISGLDILAHPILRGRAPKRICEECILTDTRRFGETYWHRAHLLPGVYHCAIHGTRLTPTTLPVQGGGTAADSLLPAECTGLAEYPNVDDDLLRSVAYFSLIALEARAGATNWFSRYLAACAALGYGLRRRAVASKAISSDLCLALGEELLSIVGVDVHLESKSPWPSLMVRPTYVTRVAATKHVLMQTFLYHATPVTDLSRAPYRRPGPQRRDYTVVDNTALARMKRFLMDQRGAGTKVTVRSLLEASGEQACIKRFGYRFPRSRTFIRKFRYSPVAKRRIVRPHLADVTNHAPS